MFTCIWKTATFAQLQWPLALSQEIKSVRPLYKNDSLAHYLSYATLMTYVPVLGAEQFYFPCRVMFDSFCSNWFKLVSAQPPNSQTFRRKKIFSFPSSRFLDQIFLCQKVRQWQTPWRTHGGSHCLTFWRRNIQTKNLDDGNMPRFFQHWRILPKLQQWLILPTCCTYQNPSSP